MRYVAFLRGVSPVNAKMPDLVRAFRAAGFRDVKTVLSSGNVVFEAKPAALRTLERRAEAAMTETLGKSFSPILRSVEALHALLAAEPHARFRLPAGSKRVVTFLRAPPDPAPKLPVSLGDARIWLAEGTEVFTSYVPGPEGPVFMTLIERTFGKDVTTRTWDTVKKVSR